MENIILEGGGKIIHLEKWAEDGDELMDSILKTFPPILEEINYAGIICNMPRLIKLVGDKPYRYAGKKFLPESWGEPLTSLVQRLNKELKFEFNSCLINYYRDGADSIAWHADDEQEVDDALIASVSLGAPRRFVVRAKNKKHQTMEYELGNGDLLCMFNLQKTHEHTVPKTRKKVGERLNLTFRKIS